MRLELPLPPSVNAAFYNAPNSARFNRPETTAWYRACVLLTRTWMRKAQILPFVGFVYCDMDMFLRRRGSDSHNYLKIYFDGLQKAGLVANDDLILPRIQSVGYDAKNPRIIASFTIKK